MTVDFHHFHLIELPERLRNFNGKKAAELARELDPLCIRINGTDNAYTFRPMAYSIDIVAGTEASVVMELSDDQWEKLLVDTDVVHELVDLKNDESILEDNYFQRWQLVMSAMFNS